MPFRHCTTHSVFALLVAVTCFGVASVAHAGGILGGRIGVSVADLDSGGDIDTEDHTGFAISGFYQIGHGNITFQPELSYIEKGAGTADSDTSLTLSYAEVALLVKVGIPIAGIQPHVFGGLAGDFETSKDSPLDLDTKSFDPNAIIGADVMLLVGPVYLVGDARYAMGLSSINEAEDLVSDLKNRAWLFSVGVGVKI